MIKLLRLLVITLLLMGSGIALASNASRYPVTQPVTRSYTVLADSSLYQLALQSGVSVSELRQLNKGSLDRRDILNAGESLLLPASSPLFPKENAQAVMVSDLPELGMGNAPVPKQGADAVEAKAAGTARFVAAQNLNSLTSDQVKDQATNLAKSQAIAPVQKGAQEFLGQFGKAQLNIAVDNKGSFKGSGGSLFSPWYQTDNTLAFSQVGIHGQDSRVIGNVGAGVRFDQGYWMWGYNAFIDQDISRNHTRGGIGAELWRDNLKLAANYYYPLSSWKDSKDFDDYLERPAQGFDVRAQGYLPVYPQLGASVVYEQYYGDEIALFGKDNLQIDPSAVTVGIDYTPMPLLTLKLSHKAGQNGKSEEKGDLQLSYQIGTPLAKQLDPDQVAQTRSLKGSRYDLVDRNYDIVLEYKEKEGVFDLDLAAVPANLLEGDDYLMQPLVHNKYRITAVNWNGDVIPLSIAATQGSDNPQGWTIKLPVWDSAPEATNRYHLSITLTDEQGHQVTSNTVEVVVGQQRKGKLEVENGASKPASGLENDSVQLVTYLTNHLGAVITDSALIPGWVVKEASTGAIAKVSESCRSNAGGKVEQCVSLKSDRTEQRDGATYYIRELVSTLPGRFLVTSDLGSYGVTSAREIIFSASKTVSEVRGKLEVEGGNPMPASGQNADAVRLAAHLQDQDGKLINDATLIPNWVVKDLHTGAVVSLVTEASCPSDENGFPESCLRLVRSETEMRDGISYYVTELVSNQPGTFIITTDLKSYGLTNSKTITFTSAESMPEAEGKLDVEGYSHMPASGQDADAVKLVAHLEDFAGKPVNDATLTPDWVAKDFTTWEPVPLVTEANCPTDEDGFPVSCLRVVKTLTEVRDGISYYVTELASNQPGTFIITSDLKSYGLTNSKTITFTSAESMIEAEGRLEVAGDNPMPASGQDADAIKLVAHLEDFDGQPVNDATLTPDWAAKDFTTWEPVPLVTEANCPTDEDGFPVSCLRVVKTLTEVRDGISYYVTELVSNQPGIFIITTDLKSYGLTNSKTITFTSAESMPEAEGKLDVEGYSHMPASGRDADAIKLVAHLEDFDGQPVNDATLTPDWVAKDFATWEPVPLVTEANCPTDEDGFPVSCLRVVKTLTEVRDGISYYVTELVSNQPGTFIITTDLKSYGLTNSKTITFTSAESVPEAEGKLEVEGDNPMPASGRDADAIKLVAHLEDFDGKPVNDATLTPNWIVKDLYTGEIASLVTEASCPTDADGFPESCLRLVRSMTEMRDGISYYVSELVSNQPGIFIVTTDLKGYGLTNSKTISFTSKEPMVQVARAEIQDPNGKDILAAKISPMIGVTYTVKLFDADNQDVTGYLPAEMLRWVLDGNASAAGEACNITLTDHDTGVTGYTFVPRPNGESNSGVVCGDQGFGLKVLYSEWGDRTKKPAAQKDIKRKG